MTQYIARWYHEPKMTTVGMKSSAQKPEPREAFVMADNPSHAEQLVKQMDRDASAIRLETCAAYVGP